MERASERMDDLTIQDKAAASNDAFDMGGLDRQVGFILRQAQLAVFKDFAAALKPFELRLADFSALSVIEANPGLKQQTLGDALNIQRPNLVAVIDQLEARGLVNRGATPGDRRPYALTLTPAGSRLLAKAKAAEALHDRRVKAALGDADAALLLDMLRRIATISST